MDTLYCYKLVKETGEITCYEINDYNMGDGEITFNLNLNGKNRKVTVHTLDTFLQSYLYTFNPDPSFAYLLIKQHFRNKISELGLKIHENILILNEIDSNI